MAAKRKGRTCASILMVTYIELSSTAFENAIKPHAHAFATAAALLITDVLVLLLRAPPFLSVFVSRSSKQSTSFVN